MYFLQAHIGDRYYFYHLLQKEYSSLVEHQGLKIQHSGIRNNQGDILKRIH